MISFSDKAVEKVQEFAAQMPEAEGKELRIFIQGVGCSGFSYGFTFDEERDGDSVIENNTVIEENDTVFFLAAQRNIRTMMQELRPLDNPVRRIILAGGGNMLLMMQQVSIDETQMFPNPQPHPVLDELLSDYGVSIPDGMVMDLRSSGRVTLPSSAGISYVAPYPLWPIVRPASAHAMVEGIASDAAVAVVEERAEGRWPCPVHGPRQRRGRACRCIFSSRATSRCSTIR